jgi:hypothetical protein
MHPDLMAMKKRLEELEQNDAAINHLLKMADSLISASKEDFEKAEMNAHFDYRLHTKVVHTREDEIRAFRVIARYEVIDTVREIRKGAK